MERRNMEKHLMRQEVEYRLTIRPLGSKLIWICLFIKWYPYMRPSIKWLLVQIRNMVSLD